MKMKLIALMLLFGSAASMVNAVESSVKNKKGKHIESSEDEDMLDRHITFCGDGNEEEHGDLYFGKDYIRAEKAEIFFRSLLKNQFSLRGLNDDGFKLKEVDGKGYKNPVTKNRIGREEAVEMLSNYIINKYKSKYSHELKKELAFTLKSVVYYNQYYRNWSYSKDTMIDALKLAIKKSECFSFSPNTENIWNVLKNSSLGKNKYSSFNLLEGKNADDISVKNNPQDLEDEITPLGSEVLEKLGLPGVHNISELKNKMYFFETHELKETIDSLTEISDRVKNLPNSGSAAYAKLAKIMEENRPY